MDLNVVISEDDTAGSILLFSLVDKISAIVRLNSFKDVCNKAKITSTYRNGWFICYVSMKILLKIGISHRCTCNTFNIQIAFVRATIGEFECLRVITQLGY